MEHIGNINKNIFVPVNWIYSEDKSMQMIKSSAIPFFKRLLNGEIVNPHDVEFLCWYAKSLSDIGQGSYDSIINQKFTNLLFMVDQSRVNGFDFELPASLDADGKFRLLDGHHRATMAIAAGEKKLNITVKHVSPMWLDLNNKLFSVYNKKTLYQEINHPWFNDWDVARVGRLGVIERFINSIGHSIEKRDCADVGSCTGHTCRGLSRLGGIVYGFDLDPRITSIAEYLNFVYPDQYVSYYLHSNAIDPIKHIGKFGIITCLSLLHHFLWKEGDGANVVRFKEWLSVFGDSSDLVIIDTTVNGDINLDTKEIPFDTIGFKKWMKEVIGIKSIVELEVNDGRPMYAYSKRLSF